MYQYFSTSNARGAEVKITNCWDIVYATFNINTTKNYHFYPPQAMEHNTYKVDKIILKTLKICLQYTYVRSNIQSTNYWNMYLRDNISEWFLRSFCDLHFILLTGKTFLHCLLVVVKRGIFCNNYTSYLINKGKFNTCVSFKVRYLSNRNRAKKKIIN